MKKEGTLRKKEGTQSETLLATRKHWGLLNWEVT